MARYIKAILSLCLAITFISGEAVAQKRNARTVKKTPRKVEQPRTGPDISDMIPATAKLLVIDSVVVDYDGFYKHIPNSGDCGTFAPYDMFFPNAKVKRPNSFVYINDFGDKCFYNDTTDNNRSMLYTADKLAGKWQKARLISEFGDEYEDINYPYLMPDGVTLYFSAKSKTKSVGGRDIFVTRLNTDSMTFYKPENVGLPYNSAADDYCCIIDDMNSIGWLVTNRRQPAGKVCIYTFVPSAKRWTDDNPDIPVQRLEALAQISRISDTWYDKQAVADAKARMNDIKKSAPKPETRSKDYALVINDKNICSNESALRSATARETYRKRNALLDMQRTDHEKLHAMRGEYSKAEAGSKKRLATAIAELEKTCEKREILIKNMEKKIRNAENLM